MRLFFENLYQNSSRITQLVYTRHIKDFILICIGVTMASIGLKEFLLPNDFLDGGAMGLSLLTEIMTGIELSVLIVLINLPFIIIGARQISIEFAVKSTLAILALSLLVHFINLPAITSDKLLISVFGGFFLGAGIGFTIRGGAVIDAHRGIVHRCDVDGQRRTGGQRSVAERVGRDRHGAVVVGCRREGVAAIGVDEQRAHTGDGRGGACSDRAAVDGELRDGARSAVDVGVVGEHVAGDGGVFGGGGAVVDAHRCA